MKENKIIKWALILSIIIVTTLFFNYTLSLIFNSPDHDDFCPFEKTSQIIQTKESCEEADGIWNPERTYAPKEVGSVEMVERGYCDLYSKCSNQYEEANKIYEQKVFVTLVAISILVLVASFFIKSNTLLAAAFALTAVLNLVVASMRYWRYSDELLKVGILFVALVVLVYLAIRKFQDKV